MDDIKLFGAIEAGGTKFVCAVADASGHLMDTMVIPTTTPVETFSAAQQFFTEKACGGAVLSTGISGLGIATFGPVEIDPSAPNYGSIQKTPKPGWTGANFINEFSSLNAPIVVDTDVNGACLGELNQGAGRGCKTLAYVTVGTGIGVGIINNGVSLSGMGHYELGHIKPPRDINRDPFKGRCPFHGDCLEGLACGPAIFDRWGASLSELPSDHDAFDLEAEYLSHLALTVIMSHMPERIIFGGGVMKTSGLYELLRTKTKSLLGGYIGAPALAGDLADYIVPPVLGDHAGITGAVTLAQRTSRTLGI